MKLRQSVQGQALMEFVFCFPLLATAIAVSALLFRTEWNRVQCAHEVFRAAHEALRSETGVAATALASVGHVQIEKTEDGVLARARCGKAFEEVRLPDLENARW